MAQKTFFAVKDLDGDGNRYAFDHPKERILWMSPSTYIEQEQEASIRRELPNYEFKNIERMTYQTAMHRAQKGNLDIHADTVIFDEFHHTGAPQWSRGVEGVIECNPDANLIGLSATSIRYSDIIVSANAKRRNEWA